MGTEILSAEYEDSPPGPSKYMPKQRSTKAANGKRTYKLLKYQDLPEHLRTNEYILNYYRSDWPLKETLCSLFSIHNETLNIWTHLAGFLIFLGLTAYTVLHLPKVVDFSYFPSLEKLRMTVEENITNLVTPFSPTQSQITRWPFFVFLGGAMCCLLFSSTYHLLNCHSKRLHVILHRLDHAGIAILIAASFYPPVYYSFICHPLVQKIYLSGITFLGLSTILFSSLPMFRTREFRPIRALLFFSMGISGIVPGVHKLFLFKDDPAALSTILYEVGMGAFYGVGALLYATRIPERLKPGFFDIVGHSHQIFHILVVTGAYTHYEAGLIYLKWRDAVGCPDSKPY
ncbi:unnamed protein product [Calypogeia fissa]